MDGRRRVRAARCRHIADPPEGQTIDDVVNAAKAWQAHEYVLAVALGINLLIAFSKSGFLGTYLANGLPPAARPIVAAVLGVLATVGIDLQQGMPWQQAVLYGLYAAGLAVFGHQVVVEGALKGVEWMPATKAVRAARATIPPPPASPSKPPPPVAPPPPAAA